MTKKIQIAICYDFDGTLSPKNMQEYDFMKKLKISPKKFWKDVTKLAKEQNADNIAAYMKLMIDELEKRKKPYNKKIFKDYGKTIKLYDGVDTWFKRIDEYVKDKNISVKHFIISSGLKEMIEGTKIAKRFEKIYASSFMYDANNIPKWPAVVLNFTTKTRYLFEINKGKNCSNINKYVPDEEREIPFSNMIYIGDGETDVPCMKIVKKEGGHSIAVYKPKSSTKLKIAEQLVKDNRVNFMAPADYTEDSHLENIVKSIIDKIISDKRLNSFKQKFYNTEQKIKNDNNIEKGINSIVGNTEKQNVAEIKETDEIMDKIEESTENNNGNI